MKQIYALIACVATAGAMTVSAQKEVNFNDASSLLDNPQIFQFDELVMIPHINQNMVEKNNVLSRGITIEEIIEECDVLTYYDYFFNWYDYPAGATEPVARDTWRNLSSGQAGPLAKSGDEYVIENYMQSGFDIPIHTNSDGEYYITAGDLLYTSSDLEYYVAVVGSEDGAINLSGNFLLTFYYDAIVFVDEDGYDYGLGIYVKDAEGNAVGWHCLGTNLTWWQSNATLSGISTYDFYNQEWASNEEMRLHVSYTEDHPTDEESHYYYTLSYILPQGYGTAVRAEIIDDKAYFNDQIAAPSIYGNDGYTGDFILTDWSLSSNAIEFGTTSLEVTYDIKVVEYNLSGTIYITLSYEGNWTPYAAESGTFSGLEKGMIVTLDVQDYVGIEGIINDNSCAAPIYYNLQGMRVANPKAGQIYIVKQGSKTSKQIYR